MWPTWPSEWKPKHLFHPEKGPCTDWVAVPRCITLRLRCSSQYCLALTYVLFLQTVRSIPRTTLSKPYSCVIVFKNRDSTRLLRDQLCRPTISNHTKIKSTQGRQLCLVWQFWRYLRTLNGTECFISQSHPKFNRYKNTNIMDILCTTASYLSMTPFWNFLFQSWRIICASL